MKGLTLDPAERDVIRRALWTGDVKRYVPEVIRICAKLQVDEPRWFPAALAWATVRNRPLRLPHFRPLGTQRPLARSEFSPPALCCECHFGPMVGATIRTAVCA